MEQEKQSGSQPYLLYKPSMQVHISAPDPIPVLMKLQGTEQRIANGLHVATDHRCGQEPPREVPASVSHYARCSRTLPFAFCLDFCFGLLRLLWLKVDYIKPKLS